MKLLFDHQVFQMQCYGGISKYFSELRKHLAQYNITVEIALRKGINKYYENPNHEKFYTYSSFLKGSEFMGKGQTYLLFQWLNLVKDLYKENQKYALEFIRNGDFDVFHPTYYDDYFLPYLNKPFVVTVHDLIHEKFPEYFNNSDEIIAKKSILIKNSEIVVAVSENTKKDLIDYYNVSENKIRVVYHGVDFAPIASNSVFLTKNFGRYIVYIGSREGYKNFSILPPAFKEFHDAGLIDTLICVGGGVFSTEERSLFKKLNIEEKVIRVSISDFEIKKLLQNAIALVITSVYEGFGLTVLEAFASQCPVILGRNSSLSEVAGEHGIYYDSSNPSSLFQKIRELINSKDDGFNSLKNIERHLKKFSWKKTALQTSIIYNEVFKGLRKL